MDTEIKLLKVSSESWPWRIKCSCRDSNPGPFDHEFNALTTELSPPQMGAGGVEYICLDLDCNICVWSPDAISIIFNVTLVSERYWSFSVSSYPFRSSFVIVECVKKGSYMRYLLMMCMGPELCSLSVPVKTVCEWIRPRRRSICEKALVVCLFWFSVCELMGCVCDQVLIQGACQ